MSSSIAGFHAEGAQASAEEAGASAKGAGAFMRLKRAANRLVFRPGLLAGFNKPAETLPAAGATIQSDEHQADVAQLVEQLIRNQQVVSSSLTVGSTYIKLNQQNTDKTKT